MKKIYYEKIGRKYVPIAEYDSDYLDSFTEGTHLVMSYPGGRSRRFNIDPNFAAMIAAGRYAEDAICNAIAKAAELRPTRTPITIGQKKAWNKLAKELGDDRCMLNGLCIRDCVGAGVFAMQDAADKLMQNPNIKQAYEEFLLMCKLSM